MISLEQTIIQAVRTLNIARAEDLPYWTSPPIQYVYESTANLVMGSYVWADLPSPLTPDRPILDNALYFFRNISLIADIDEFDFEANLVTPPQFFTFKQSDSRAVLFREPILMNKYYDQFEYRFFWTSHITNDQLFAAFRGSLVQGANLIGKASITLKAIISAQEIVDESFIQLFKKNYPAVAESGVPL